MSEYLSQVLLPTLIPYDDQPVAVIEHERVQTRLIQDLMKAGITHPAILGAMATVPRHLFVDDVLAKSAYVDLALPIGYNQTISKPSTVARMIELLWSKGSPARILEIGTGCGYQTAVLHALGAEVYSIERFGGLHQLACTQLAKAGYIGPKLMLGDGYLGWPQAAPFDAIVISAATHIEQISTHLFAQLKQGGLLVAPIDEGHQLQFLYQFERISSADIQPTKFEQVSFVPMLPGVIA